MKQYSRLAKVGVFWSVLRDGINEILHIPTAMVLARLLTPYEFGVSAAAYLFMHFAERATGLGFSAGLVRMKELRPDHIASVFTVDLAICTITWLLLTLGAPAIGGFFNSPEIAMLLPIAALKFLVTAFGPIPAALLSREFAFERRALTDWMGAITYSVSTIAFAWAGYSFWSLVYGDLLKSIVRHILLVYTSGWVPRLGFSRIALSEMFSFGMGVYAKGLLTYAAQNLDNLVVGRVLGVTALGLYDKAFSTMGRFVSRIALSGPGVSFRIFAIIHEDQERFRRAYRKVTLGASIVGFPCMAAAIVMAPNLFLVLFGDQWGAAVVPFQILGVAGMLKLLASFASSASQAKGRIWAEVTIQAIYAVLVVVGVIVLSPWGVIGAAVGVLAATIVMCALMMDLVRRAAELEWSDLLAPQVAGWACSVGLVPVLLLAAALLTRAMPHPAPWQFVLAQSCAGVLFYAAFVWFSPFHDVRNLARETVCDFAPGFARRFEIVPDRPSNAVRMSQGT